MSRQRSPDREKAVKMWIKSGRQMKPAEIAEKLDISASMVRKWKSMDRWDELPNPKPGAPRGNRNAKGNKGGSAPLRNDNAVKSGLFRKFLPQDPEFLEIMDMVEQMDPLDMIWHNITTIFQKIIWSERIMYVSDKDDETKRLTKSKETETGFEKQWEYQYAWDKLANAMKAQAAAMREHRALVKQFLSVAPENDERRLKLQQMEQNMMIEREKLELAKAKLEIDLKNAGGGNSDTGNIDQLTDMIQKSAAALGGA